MEQGPGARKKHCWALAWLQPFSPEGRVPKGSVTVPILTLGSSVQGMRSGRGQGAWDPASILPPRKKNRARRKAGSRRGGLLPSLLSREDHSPHVGEKSPPQAGHHHTSVISSPNSASSSSSSSSSSSEVTLGSSASARHLGQEQTNR